MKYWNKDKDIRRRCWTKVKRSSSFEIGNREMKRWCQQQSSKGKFYYYYGSPNWWFERAEDATMFVLRWS